MTETICTCWNARDDEWALERVTCPSHGVAALRRAAAASVATEAPKEMECADGELLHYAKAAVARDGYYAHPRVVRWLAEYVVRKSASEAPPPQTEERMSILVDRDAEMLLELRRHLDTLVINGDNIGAIRRSMFVPWNSQWNGWVRDETAQRETKAATDSADFPRCSACGAAIWGEHSIDCPKVAPAPPGPSRLPTRFAWLMERDVDGQPAYWDGGHAESFTRDANRAVQWCRKQDLLDCTKFTQHYAQWKWRPVEHGFIGDESTGGPSRLRALLDVARALDEFQRFYAEHTYDTMPGNEFYSGKLMAIVEAAREALNWSPGGTRKDE